MPGFCSCLVIILPWALSAHFQPSSQSKVILLKPRRARSLPNSKPSYDFPHHTEESQVLTKLCKPFLICFPTKSHSAPALISSLCSSHRGLPALLHGARSELLPQDFALGFLSYVHTFAKRPFPGSPIQPPSRLLYSPFLLFIFISI